MKYETRPVEVEVTGPFSIPDGFSNIIYKKYLVRTKNGDFQFLTQEELNKKYRPVVKTHWGNDGV